MELPRNSIKPKTTHARQILKLLSKYFATLIVAVLTASAATATKVEQATNEDTALSRSSNQGTASETARLPHSEKDQSKGPDYTMEIVVYTVLSSIFIRIFRARFPISIVLYLTSTVLLVRYVLGWSFTGGFILIAVPSLMFLVRDSAAFASAGKAAGSIFKTD